jgi:hypothetical protein
MDFMEFENNGRKLTCRRGSSPATPGTSWWWLDVSGENQRYTAFRSEPTDTPENLRPRVIAWYEQLLVDRARPREIRPRWGRPAAKSTEPQPVNGPEEAPTT